MDILWIVELILAGTAGFLCGVALVWHMIVRDMDRKRITAVDDTLREQLRNEPPCLECETCGSVTAHRVDGMCGVCQRMYKK